MEPLHVTLREDSRIFHFSFDSVGNREYSIRSRSGTLERNFNGGWKNRSIETGSAEEGRNRKGAGRGTHTGKTGTELSMDAGRILEGRATLDEVGREIHELVLAVAEGRQTKSEALGHQEFILGYKTFQPIGPACLPTAP